MYSFRRTSKVSQHVTVRWKTCGRRARRWQRTLRGFRRRAEALLHDAGQQRRDHEAQLGGRAVERQQLQRRPLEGRRRQLQQRRRRRQADRLCSTTGSAGGSEKS